MPTPALPVETIAHIVSYIPASRRGDLCRLALVSHSFRTFAQRQLLQVLNVDLEEPNHLAALPLLAETLEMPLGRTVKALRIQGSEFSRDRDSTSRMWDAAGCMDSLEELSLEYTSLEHLADLLASLPTLRLLNLTECWIKEPSTALAAPPLNNVKHLALRECNLSGPALPTSSFSSLITFSWVDREGMNLIDFYPFLFSLPPTLRALRLIQGEGDWSGLYRDDDENVLNPSRTVWEQAFQGWTALEHFEINYRSSIDFSEEDVGECSILSLFQSGTALKSMKFVIEYPNLRWPGEITKWLTKAADAPPCMSTVNKISILQDFVEEGPWNAGPLDSQEMLLLEEECGARGIQLNVTRADYWDDMVYSDPFGTGLISEQRWLRHFHDTEFLKRRRQRVDQRDEARIALTGSSVA